jgi:enoyl-CoA hydratase/carnithine racemase
MAGLQSTRSDSLAVVTLEQGKANALNGELIAALHKELSAAVADDDVRGVVLASARPRFFSGGFDVAEVFSYDPPTMTEFFGQFIDLYEQILRTPKPVVAAVSGHAFAGGAVLALACDARVLAEGEYGFALNEVNLGIVLPPGVMRMAIDAVGGRHARELILAGKALSPARALEIGLAAELAPAEDVLARAKARATELAEKPPSALAAVKQAFSLAVGHPATPSDRAFLPEFIRHWFSDECVKLRQALAQSMRR